MWFLNHSRNALFAALCLAGSIVPKSSSDAAAGVEASAVGEAIIVVPLEIGIITEVIRIADQDVPMHSDRTTMNVDSTKTEFTRSATRFICRAIPCRLGMPKPTSKSSFRPR